VEVEETERRGEGGQGREEREKKGEGKEDREEEEREGERTVYVNE